VVAELGVRSYFLYGYKEAQERDTFVQNVIGVFHCQFSLYFLLGAIGCVVAWALHTDVTLFLVFVFSRLLFTYYITFYGIYYRIVDRPSAVFVVSILVNLASCLMIWAAASLGGRVGLWSVFLAQFLFITGVTVKGLVAGDLKRFRVLLTYMGKALRYAWPVTLNVFLVMFVQNFGKIYAMKALSPEAMTHIALSQRVSLIIQLAHASGAGYLCKNLFLDTSKGINWRIFMLVCPMFAGVVQIKVHLPSVSMCEPPELQVDDDETAQPTMEEDQVYSIPLIVDPQPALTRDEGEVVAEFEEEVFEVADDGVFELGLGTFIAQTEEFEHERVFNFLLGGQGVTRLGFRALGEEGGFVPRQGSPLVELTVHLAAQLPDGPAAAQGFGVVEVERFGRAGAADEQDVVRPGEREGASEVAKVELG